MFQFRVFGLQVLHHVSEGLNLAGVVCISDGRECVIDVRTHFLHGARAGLLVFRDLDVLLPL